MAPDQQRHLEELVGAHLDGCLSAEQTSELAALLAADAEARTLFARSLALDTVLPRVAVRRRRPIQLWSASAAAALLVLGLGAWLLHGGVSGPTLQAGSNAVVLRDGRVLRASETGPLQSADRIRATTDDVVISWSDEATHATLAAGSGLELVAAGPAKELLLEEGTVTIDAGIQNGSRHLAVRTGQLSVAVVGTRFRVSDVAGTSTVAVEHGTVMVDAGDGAQAVTAGQVATCSSSGASHPLRIGQAAQPAAAIAGVRLDAAAWRAVNGVGWTGQLRPDGIAAVIDTATAERIQAPQRPDGYARLQPDLRITADISLAKPATVAVFLICRGPRDWIGNYRIEMALPAGRHQRVWTMADLTVEKGLTVAAAQGAQIGSVVVCAWHQPVGLVVHAMVVGNAVTPAPRP